MIAQKGHPYLLRIAAGLAAFMVSQYQFSLTTTVIIRPSSLDLPYHPCWTILSHLTMCTWSANVG